MSFSFSLTKGKPKLQQHSKFVVEDKSLDNSSKAHSLKEEACSLVEAGKYHQALGCFDEAIGLSPESAGLYELKAQVLLELGEYFKAIKAAEQSIRLDPLFAFGYLTLGRAQINFGELDYVRRLLSKKQLQ